MSETPQSKNKQGAIGASTAKNSQKSNYHTNAQHSDGAGANHKDSDGGRRNDLKNPHKSHRFGFRSKSPRQHAYKTESQENVRSVDGRAGYRPAKPKAPEIDSDVTGRELDSATSRQLRALESRNAATVAKHLVMTGRYLELDPQFALEHAVAASRSAGRISAVREAVGVAAYVAEDYELALRELRTHRRISGSLDHLALLVDCERALNRISKALDMIEEAKREELPAQVRVELAIVESGIYADQGKKSQAISALQIPQLNPKRAFEYSPRLFTAYSEALDNAGRSQEAEQWARLAFRAEAALGQGEFAEPEIFDIYGESELFEPEEPVLEDLEQQSNTDEGTQPEKEETYSSDKSKNLAVASSEYETKPSQNETEQ